MAGSDDSNTQPPADEPKPRVGKARSFTCSHCGSGITLRNSESLSTVCQTCHSIIDTSDENYLIIQRFIAVERRAKPYIALGTRGEMFGHKWECIGFIVRQDSRSHFCWDEYLLFNPYQGYRWLTLCNGHWNFVTMVKERPESIGTNLIAFRNQKFRLYERGNVLNLIVMGEFYWKLTQGQPVLMEDYISPPLMLTGEYQKSERGWSLSTYVKGADVEKAFKLIYRATPSGVHANQPSVYTSSFQQMLVCWGAFFAILTMMQMFQSGNCLNRLVISQNCEFIPNYQSKSSTTTPVFVIDKPVANVEIKIGAPVSNSWFYLSGELVNNDTGVSYPFDRNIEYYSGVDSDGAWSEGGQTGDVLIGGVPAGKYYIDYDYESGSFQGTIAAFSLNVWRDVSTSSDYFWCLFLISIMPVWYFVLSRGEEIKRWANSDYSPYTSGG